MSKLKDLIKELCPNGVEYKLLKDVSEMKRGQSITTKNLKVGKIPVIAGGQEPSFYNDKYNREGETITVSSSGAYAGFLNYWNEPILCTDSFSIKAKKLNMRYLYHYLKMKQNKIYNKKRGAGIPHVHISDLEKFKIPCPPLEVQGEIVRILDKFGELEAELEAELETRKTQYEFWRERLFKFNKEECKTYKLYELFNNKNGYTPSKNNTAFWTDGKLPWFRMEDIRENGRILNDSVQHITDLAIKNSGLFPANSIIVSTSATIGEHALIKVPFLCNQRFTCISLKDEYKDSIDMEYIYQYCFLLDDYCKNNVQQGNFNSVNLNVFKNFEFKIPPLEKQREIVNVLNKFEKLTESISDGLPAEIELRRKQYEYYRNKLLGFEELNYETIA